MTISGVELNAASYIFCIMVKQEKAQAPQPQAQAEAQPSRRSLSLSLAKSPARVHPSDTTLPGDGPGASGFQVVTIGTDADMRPPASEPVAPAMEASAGTAAAHSGGTVTETATLGSGQGSGGGAGTTSTSTDTVPVTSHTVVAAPPPADGALESAPSVTSPVGAYASAVSAAVGEVVMKVCGSVRVTDGQNFAPQAMGSGADTVTGGGKGEGKGQ